MIESDVQTLIKVCTACGQNVGLPSPKAGKLLELVQCQSCKQRHYVAAGENYGDNTVLGDGALFGFSPANHLSSQRESSFQQLLEKLTAGNSTNDRRLHTRLLAAIPLVVAPLDGEYRPVGPASNATSIDISAGGISFLVPSNDSASFWLIDFSLAGLVGNQAIMKVVRMEPAGDAWKVAGPLAGQRDSLGY